MLNSQYLSKAIRSMTRISVCFYFANRLKYYGGESFENFKHEDEFSDYCFKYMVTQSAIEDLQNIGHKSNT